MNVRSSVALLLSTLLYLVVFFLSESSSDHGDGIRHHEIARYSWNHPELLLDHWGKPLFTLLLSPFAQLGIGGSMLFNMLCTLITAFLCFRISEHLKLPSPWLSAVLYLFAPVVFSSSFSGLTEPLFALFLAASVLFLLKEKYIAAALLLSFLPFVRTEGFVLLAVFQLFFLLERKWMSLLFTVTGTIVYSVIGGIYYGDLLWLIHLSPYHTGENIYGSGPWHYFISRNEFIYGIPFFVLSIGALIYGLLYGIRKPDKKVFFLILLPYTVFFLLHSILWATGIQAGGMLIVMVGGMPLLAILSLYGLRLLNQWTGKWQIAGQVFPFLFAFTALIFPFKQFGWGFKPSIEEKVITEALTNIAHFEIVYSKFWYLHPSITLQMDADPFDPAICQELWSLNKQTPSAGLPSGELLIWDSHFGRYEGGLLPETLDADTGLRLVGTCFSEKEEPDLMGGKKKYEVRVYLTK